MHGFVGWAKRPNPPVAQRAKVEACPPPQRWWARRKRAFAHPTKSFLAMTAVYLNRLPRIRHRRRQPAVHRDRLSIDIRRFVAGQEESHRREFMRLARSLQRIQLPDLV